MGDKRKQWVDGRVRDWVRWVGTGWLWVGVVGGGGGVGTWVGGSWVCGGIGLVAF